MRLAILDQGQKPLDRLKLKAMNLVVGHFPGPVAVSSYRAEFFGKHFNNCLGTAMRQSTQWQKREVELFAAFVSRVNQCHY
jgi:hypothetical protein